MNRSSQPKDGANSNQEEPSTTSGGKWRHEEWTCVNERRVRAHGIEPGDPKAEPKELTGLALSGGGIRSALFNDGFLQGLSHRGLLRYFDFMCSVSGGGYIAGHLTAQANSEVEPQDTQSCFHDDAERSSMGRDPKTGKVDSARLAGVGGYLSRPFVFLPAYLWSFFFSLAVYLGITGIIATVAALFWRSFDDIGFRRIYGRFLGLTQFGDELLIAFIPFLGLLVLMVVGEAVLTAYRYRDRYEDPTTKRLHTRFRATMLLLLVFAALTSVAIFLGNEKTSVRGGDGMVYLNRYAQYFAMLAAGIQVIVFMGRDRLFRSERGEAKAWQRHLQQGITSALIVFVVFSMVHWMGRENISRYTQFRDPHLVEGDIVNWNAFLNSPLAQQPLTKPSPFEKKALSDQLEIDEIRPLGSWKRSLVNSCWGLGFHDEMSTDLSSPQPYPEQNKSSNTYWSLPRRIGAASYAYVISHFPSLGAFAPGETTKRVRSQLIADDDRRKYRKTYLNQFNREIGKISLTRDLIAAFGSLENNPTSSTSTKNASSTGSQDTADESPKPNDGSVTMGVIPARLHTLITSTDTALKRSQRELLLTFCQTVVSNPSLSNSPEDKDTNDSAKWNAEFLEPNIARVNRLLLEMLYPNMIQEHDIASTLVVPVHDQQSRTRWLSFWCLLTLIGLIGGLGPHRIGTVFQYYRRQVAACFLTANRPPPPSDYENANSSQDPSPSAGDEKIHRLHSYRDGLPYHLVLATALEPSLSNGSYRVRSWPFVFSPRYSGNFEKGETPIKTEFVSFSRRQDSPALTFGDAITLSGAAVTPLMTDNRGLSVVLDFFNTGIGQRVWRTDQPSDGQWISSDRPLVVSFVFAVAAALLSHLTISAFVSAIPIAAVTYLFVHCWMLKTGTPGLVRSLLLPSELPPDQKINHKKSHYVADGGYEDYLGVSELLRRRCELIVVSDAGANVGRDSLGTLARMCEKASRRMGIRFLDLDHEAPIDFGRLEINEQRLVHQPFILMRVRYPESEGRPDGLLVYCQMSITESDPIEIQQIRNLFPSFPDEPTVNQFYNPKQVAAYRILGYHIANRLCNELHPWKRDCADVANIAYHHHSSHKRQRRSKRPQLFRDLLKSTNNSQAANLDLPPASEGQPLMKVLKERLLTSYRLACYEEKTYRPDDIFSEAIWSNKRFAFPTFANEHSKLHARTTSDCDLSDYWLQRYEANSDIRSAYRTAVINDINSLDVGNESWSAILWESILKPPKGKVSAGIHQRLLAAHLTCLAAACQEIHRGRPHAAFQVGGRRKLIDLCQHTAEVVSLDPLRKRGSIEQSLSSKQQMERLGEGMDQIITELIEMERSVFQGSEHVATVSFAQCVSITWGRGLRPSKNRQPDTFTEELKELNLFGHRGMLSNGKEDDFRPHSTTTADLMAAEVRHQLDLGLKKLQLLRVRNALFRSWLLGYLTKDQLKVLIEYGNQHPDQDQEPSPSKQTATDQST